MSGWREQAACIGMNPAIFWADLSRWQARETCARCTVRAECLQDALTDSQVRRDDAAEGGGFRGGMTSVERETARRRIARARQAMSRQSETV